MTTGSDKSRRIWDKLYSAGYSGEKAKKVQHHMQVLKF
jgi:hypothetical protein